MLALRIIGRLRRLRRLLGVRRPRPGDAPDPPAGAALGADRDADHPPGAAGGRRPGAAARGRGAARPGAPRRSGASTLARRLLAGSLDRAVDVAATLELRGYARGAPAPRRAAAQLPPQPALRRRRRRDRSPSAIAARLAGAGEFEPYPTVTIDADAGDARARGRAAAARRGARTSGSGARGLEARRG